MEMMSFRFGSNDLERSRAFYEATFAAINGPTSNVPANYPILKYALPGGPVLIIGAARDGKPATHANGGTVLFAVDREEHVAAWHAAGLANGGTCEGAAEPKPQTGGKVGAYLRDPDGNKLGVYYGFSVA